MKHLAMLCFACLAALGAPASRAEVSAERGLYLSTIAGCHDCHTEGYRDSEGVIDPDKALRGSAVGWQGPWGTTYAHNLRRRLEKLSEDEFVSYARTIHTYPPMPWYRLRIMEEEDLRSIYRYVRSLGEPGPQAPEYVAPGGVVRTEIIVLSPPQTPPACTRDFDCGVGEICGNSTPRRCMKR